MFIEECAADHQELHLCCAVQPRQLHFRVMINHKFYSTVKVIIVVFDHDFLLLMYIILPL